ncbi:uncharacterized protein MONBRDRAFT_26242 [Monosiga brevicollis MX1]|uniref:SAM domain-containing protein n=1 Tax=Monosiga brevicollis TaxID=81824 RepID=A9V1T0_MONBE|nr:uncharacterized protein MONBRDRAFT_26242 [Monosiga brevicollis MX1]EDQ88617.1 predicted protein [Monosiga brevicollis MX1]|eukprot:XP_001746721.1 hypothetical protein [Monosiga brevicollis MX1]
MHMLNTSPEPRSPHAHVVPRPYEIVYWISHFVRALSVCVCASLCLCLSLCLSVSLCLSLCVFASLFSGCESKLSKLSKESGVNVAQTRLCLLGVNCIRSFELRRGRLHKTNGVMATLNGGEEFTWLNFFLNAGIPEAHALSYSDVFEDNRITPAMIDELSREILQELGVAIMGDVIAIQKYAKEYSEARNPPKDSVDVNQFIALQQEYQQLQQTTEMQLSKSRDRENKLLAELKRARSDIQKLREQLGSRKSSGLSAPSAPTSVSIALSELNKVTGDGTKTITAEARKRSLANSNQSSRKSTSKPTIVRSSSVATASPIIVASANPAPKKSKSSIFDRISGSEAGKTASESKNKGQTAPKAKKWVPGLCAHEPRLLMACSHVVGLHGLTINMIDSDMTHAPVAPVGASLRLCVL